MLRYEILFLAVPEISLEDAGAIEAQVRRVVQEADGKLVSCERWGKYRLAYPIQKREYGVYFLVRFELPKEGVKARLATVQNVFVLKFNELVMRHVATRLDVHAQLAYQRPESLEEVALKAEVHGRESRHEDRHQTREGREESGSAMQGEA